MKIANAPVMFNNDIPSINDNREPFPPGNHRLSYILFYELCRERDFPLLFASPYDYNWEKSIVNGIFESKNDSFVIRKTPVKPTFVFDKASGADPHCTAVIEHCEARGLPIFGHPGLARLCGDKWRSYLHFAQFSPLTALLARDRASIVDQIYAFFEEMDQVYADHDNRVVVKPLHGYQSRGIHLIERHPHGLEMHMLFGGQLHGMAIEHNLDVMSSIPYMIQAWVNTGCGIPGIGLQGEFHDVRFVFHIKQPGSAEFIMLYVKTMDGMQYIPLDQFSSANPFEIVNPIADWISAHFPYGVFSVDVMRDISGRWFLTELNDQVGLTLNFSNTAEIHETTRFMEIYIEDMKRYAI